MYYILGPVQRYLIHLLFINYFDFLNCTALIRMDKFPPEIIFFAFIWNSLKQCNPLFYLQYLENKELMKTTEERARLFDTLLKII